jgi:prepilin-type N-terminal cleavage/methylation domain-containing protein
MLPSATRRGFTLIEMCVAIGIALMLMAVALPSITGQMGRERLQQAFDRLEALAAQAQQLSINEGRAYVMVWADEGTALRLYPAAWNAKERHAGAVAALIPSPNEHYSLDRDASLSHAPDASWIFWPSGNCEPVIVRFEGPNGTWTADFSPLSARGTMSRFVVR